MNLYRHLMFLLLGFAIFTSAQLIQVAESQKQWTGIAVSKQGRIFVNYPRWSDNVPVSVAEITKDGKVQAFPNQKWNNWQPSASTKDHFVCVQSVYVDDKDFLWILDPANPKFQGVKKDGPKLFKVNLHNNSIIQTIYFPPDIAPKQSYLNDIRVDTQNNIAYMTDSGLGAIIVLNLNTGKARRLLGNHASTKAEDVVLTIGGKKWLWGEQEPQVHSDGIALHPGGNYLYYQALTGRSLYRIATKWLRDPSLSSEKLATKVEFLGKTGAADGLIFDNQGNLYLSSLEHDAIRRFTPDQKAEVFISDKRIIWPDSFSIRHDFLYFTTAQIHLGDKITQPYRIFKVALNHTKTINNRVKKLLNRGNSAFGGFVTIANHKVIENMAVANKLDFIWIESEHTEMGPKEVQELTIVCENENLVPIVRVAENHPDHIKKYIGTGVMGVIVPAIGNAEEAKRAIAAIKYPPQGNRPAGVERGNRYLGNFQKYKSKANDEILVILMIETTEAVANIESIVAVSGIDILHMGPYDLSLSMGVSMDSPKLKDAVRRVEKVAQKHNIALGSYAPSLSVAREKQQRGYRFFTIPGDMQLLQSGVKEYFQK